MRSIFTLVSVKGGKVDTLIMTGKRLGRFCKVETVMFSSLYPFLLRCLRLCSHNKIVFWRGLVLNDFHSTDSLLCSHWTLATDGTLRAHAFLLSR